MAKKNTKSEKRPPSRPTVEASDKLVFQNKWLVTLSFIGPLIIYLLTAGRSVTFEDSGLFISSAATWGLPQPPGYPLYTFLGYIFSWLPIGELAFRVHVLSVLCSAGACLFLYLSSLRLGFSGITALIVSWTLAVSDIFWSQAVVAEVYALHILLFSALFYLSLRIKDDPSVKNFVIFGIVLGLGLANHWPLLILSSPVLFFISWERYREIFKRSLIWIPVALVVSGVFYIMMMYRSQAEPGISFLGAISNFGELIDYITRAHYREIEAFVEPKWDDKPLFVWDFIKSILWTEWSLLGPVLIGIGIYQSRRYINWHHHVAIWMGVLSSTVFLQMALHLEFNIRNQNTMKVFHLVPIFCLCLLMGYGLRYLVERWGSRVFYGVAILLCAALIQNYMRNDLRTDRFGEDYVHFLLKALPQDGKTKTLIAGADEDIGPLAYVIIAKNERPDIKLTSQSGLLFQERMFNPRLKSARKKFERTLDYFKNEGTVYSTRVVDVFAGKNDLPLATHFNGLFYAFSYGPPVQLDVGDDYLQEAKRIVTDYMNNPRDTNWHYYREAIVTRLCNFIVLRDLDHPAFERVRACKQVYGRHMAAQKKYEDADRIYSELMADSELMFNYERHILRYHKLINRLEWINSMPKTLEEKVELVREAADEASVALYEYPHCDNSAYVTIDSLQPHVALTERTRKALTSLGRCKVKKVKIESDILKDLRK